MASPPWAGAASHEQYFVLLTGANSGVGLGIGQRIIDEFLASRSLSSHLILIPTTRSVAKSRDTARALRAHLERTARTSERLRARAGGSGLPGSSSCYTPESAIARVHVLGLQLDLCNLRSVYRAARQLVRGEVSDPTGVIPDAKIPRIDAALFNAGVGGWSGLDWLGLLKQFFRVGLVQATTFPSFKKASPAAVLDHRTLLGGDPNDSDLKAPPPPDDGLAEVFCANVFGHYVLAHELLPLLSRAGPDEPRGRVIWTSTIDAGREHLRFDDFQARRGLTPPYESSKRITDLVALTSSLPGVEKVSAPFFFAAGEKPVRPRFYLSHPGVVCSPLFPLSAVLFWAYWYAMLLARWCGSPWHPVRAYLGACASVWLALADQDALDALRAERSKWGTACTPRGRVAPKKTEIEGWAWEGEVVGGREALGEKDEDEDEHGAEKGWSVLRKSRGRKWDAVDLTEERRAEFEEDGRRCWAELERLRTVWEAAALGKEDGNGNAA
ncbi:3-keto-steroid reductase [Hypoxylon texense]